MKPQIEREITLSVPEHVVYIAFNSDDDASVFYDWWVNTGEDQFHQWLAEQEYRDGSS